MVSETKRSSENRGGKNEIFTFFLNHHLTRRKSLLLGQEVSSISAPKKESQYMFGLESGKKETTCIYDQT